MGGIDRVAFDCKSVHRLRNQPKELCGQFHRVALKVLVRFDIESSEHRRENARLRESRIHEPQPKVQLSDQTYEDKEIVHVVHQISKLDFIPCTQGFIDFQPTFSVGVRPIEEFILGMGSA